jgi:hypothetical protein
MDADGSIVDWRPSPNRRRLVLRWIFRCLIAGAFVAGAWSLRGNYPRIALSGTSGPAKQVEPTRARAEPPMDVSTRNERIVDKKLPGEWRPPRDMRSVVRTVPTE